MLKIPNISKYRKFQKGNLKNTVSGNYTFKNIIKGIGLKSVSAGRLDLKHLGTFRQTLNKSLKKICQINTCIYSHTPVTKKPSEIRMGKGKGSVDKWVANVRSSQTLFQLEGGLDVLKIAALKQIKKKIPIKTKIVYEI